MAWLDVTPEKEKLPRRSSLEMDLRRGEDVPDLDAPAVDWTLEYLVDYLFQIGPTEGEHELTFGEMTAWCRRTGADLDDFESTALKQMSRAYLSMTHQARARDAKNPAIELPDLDEMAPDDAAAQRAKVANSLSKWFGATNDAAGQRGMAKPKKEM